jgi:hypothetical protein
VSFNHWKGEQAHAIALDEYPSQGKGNFSRATEDVPLSLSKLADQVGILETDAFGGYAKLYEAGPT